VLTNARESQEIGLRSGHSPSELVNDRARDCEERVVPRLRDSRVPEFLP
jgi:hypothetical protein